MIKNNSIRKMKRDIKAVSPVIATILLVLVAVASAVAFWVVMDNWQGTQGEKLNDVDIQGDKTTTGTIRMAGSSTVAPFVEAAIAGFNADVYPFVKVSYATVDSGYGRSTIKAGTVEIGGISDKWGSKIVSGVSEDKAFPNIVAHTIGYDGVVVASHNEALKEKDLTEPIVRAIFETGTINTWEKLATAIADGTIPSSVVAPLSTETAIEVVTRESGSGTLSFFAEKLLGDKNREVLDSATVQSGNNEMVTYLKNNGNAIGFASFGHASGASLSIANYVDDDYTAKKPTLDSIKAGTYAGSRPLVLLTDGEPTGIVKAFIDYVQGENNKKFADQSGYASIY